jgi:hypothetical protein
LTVVFFPDSLRAVSISHQREGLPMSAAQLQKYLMNIAFVALAIGIIATVQRRVPVIGPLVQKVTEGL